MKKNKLYNFLILLFLYIGISCIPFELFIEKSYICLWCRIGVQILFLICSFLVVKFKTDFDLLIKKRNWKNVLILLPTIITAASNFLYLAFVPTDFNISYSSEIILKILLTIFVVLNEEFIFRLILINNLDNASNWKKILISAGVFAASHLTVFISSLNPYDLIVPVYTFALGVLLAIIFVKANSIEMCAVFHLLFNVINSILFEMIVPSVSNIGFYFLGNIIPVILVVVYLGVLLLSKKIAINEEK